MEKNIEKPTELKKVLSFGDLLSTAVGQVIGAGIMSLTGVAIGMTGRSVPLAFLLSALVVIIASIPTIIISGTVRMRGGYYTMTALLMGERWAGVYIVLFIFQNIAVSMFALSFADYFSAFLPWNRQLVAFVILTIVFLLNITGTKNAARFQNVIVIILCVALGLFAAVGLGHLEPNYFSDSFLPAGVGGVMAAGAMLCSATGGATMVTNLSAEAKNSKRDIPIVIIVSTMLVAVIYALVSVVAAGVLPVSEVAYQPLTAVAQTILPTPLYVFFMVGGAMFALLSTLNAQMSWAPKPVIQACEDGWFPQKLATLTKWGTPKYLLLIIYVIGVIPIALNVDLSIISNITAIIIQLTLIIMNIGLVRLPEKIPEAWDKSKYKVSKGALMAITVLTIVVGIVQIYELLDYLGMTITIVNIVMFALAGAYAILRFKSGKVKMEISYEADMDE